MSTSVDPIGGRRFPGMHPDDAALHAVREAVAAATARGLEPSLILGQVANGLTGRINGYVERASAHAMADAHAEVVAAAQPHAS